MRAYRSTQELPAGCLIPISLAVVLLVIFSLWLHISAPCKYVGWMPAQDVPNRCLHVTVNSQN